MGNKKIIWLDLERGIPSMTIARYGITLNSTATDIIDNYELARIGYYKEEKLLVVAAANLEDYNGKIPAGWFLVRDKITSHGYFRLNNKDLVRIISQYADLDLGRKNRFMAYWNEENRTLSVNLLKPLDTEKEKFSRRKSDLPEE
ncbi:MAG: hypothetical protein WAO23_07980 [Dethiobacteria bacterium]